MKKKILWVVSVLVILLALAQISVFASGDEPKADTGDTAFMIICSAMVFLMTPGLAFFYGGMVRQKNVLNTMMNSFTTIPHSLFSMYQMMFAIITPALITGAFAERMKYSAFVVFTLLWATFVYDPLAHWVWGTGGWWPQ